VVLIVGSGLALHVAQAQQPGIKRTDLQRHDLSVPGREVIQARVELAPGVLFGKLTYTIKQSDHHQVMNLLYEVQGSEIVSNQLSAPAGGAEPIAHSTAAVGSTRRPQGTEQLKEERCAYLSPARPEPSDGPWSPP
jgi:hypothetical protein